MRLDDLDQAPSGADLLDKLRATIVRYVVLPGDAARDAVVLWIAATHAQAVWEHASRLVLKSPLRRCGKTRLLEIIVETAHRPLPTTNISVAALVRSIDEQDPPTLVLDEADAIFSKRRGERSESAEDLRGILNAGHSRGWPYRRWNAASRQAEECPTFAMAAIAAIGDLPDTIEDRAVVIAMQRRGAGEPVAQYRRREAVPALHDVRERLHDWVVGQHAALADARPDVPAEDRAADVWEPLMALADAAGGDWPARARKACRELVAGASDPADGDASERLLADLYEVFGAAQEPGKDGAAQLATAEILERLCAMEESPWGDWYGRPLRARDLARLLKPYGIKPKVIRVGDATPRGYERADFSPVWARYTRPAATAATGATNPPEGAENESEGDVADDDPAIRNTSATGRFESENGANPGGVADVAAVAAGRLQVVDARYRWTCPECGAHAWRRVDGRRWCIEGKHFIDEVPA
jgi:hypothetical protein